MPTTTDVLGTVLSALLLALTIAIGLGVRWVRDHLLEPVRETHKQVTVNHHSSENPTVLDRIDDVSKQVAANTRLTAQNADETRALARMFDGHLEEAQRAQEEGDRIRRNLQDDVDRIWRELRETRDRKDDTP
jgi:hypothetical protein